MWIGKCWELTNTKVNFNPCPFWSEIVIPINYTYSSREAQKWSTPTAPLSINTTTHLFANCLSKVSEASASVIERCTSPSYKKCFLWIEWSTWKIRKYWVWFLFSIRSKQMQGKPLKYWPAVISARRSSLAIISIWEYKLHFRLGWLLRIGVW